MKIILATKSPYRQETFRTLGLDFIVDSSDVQEKFDGRSGNPEELVKVLSRMKAEAVAKKHKDGIVIGFDSVGWFNGKILEKPKTKEDAFLRLKLLSGKECQFITGIHMINIDRRKSLSKVVVTNVSVRAISDSEITRYLNQDPNFNTFAIGYETRLLNLSASFTKKLDGSYSNYVTGLPLAEIVEMLKEIGYISQQEFT